MTRAQLEHVIRASAAIAGVDRVYTRALAKHGMTKRDTLMKRLADTAVAGDVRTLTETRIEADFGTNPSPDGQ